MGPQVPESPNVLSNGTVPGTVHLTRGDARFCIPDSVLEGARGERPTSRGAIRRKRRDANERRPGRAPPPRGPAREVVNAQPGRWYPSRARVPLLPVVLAGQLPVELESLLRHAGLDRVAVVRHAGADGEAPIGGQPVDPGTDITGGTGIERVVRMLLRRREETRGTSAAGARTSATASARRRCAIAAASGRPNARTTARPVTASAAPNSSGRCRACQCHAGR